MTNTNIKSKYKTTYHRDKTVSYWSVYEQRWLRVTAYSLTNNHEDFASLNDVERKRICRMAGFSGQ